MNNEIENIISHIQPEEDSEKMLNYIEELEQQNEKLFHITQSQASDIDILTTMNTELEQQNNTLEQYLRIEKEVSDETIKELEQQKTELCEKLIAEILKMSNLKSEYCQASIIIIRNALDNLGYKTDKPKY